MAKHTSCALWMLRRPGVYPNGWVRTWDKDRIAFFLVNAEGEDGYGYVCPRKDARLLAKRILECLEATK